MTFRKTPCTPAELVFALFTLDEQVIDRDVNRRIRAQILLTTWWTAGIRQQERMCYALDVERER